MSAVDTSAPHCCSPTAQEENQRLQNKVLRVESESARISDLEDANRKLTQVHMFSSWWYVPRSQQAVRQVAGSYSTAV